MAEKIQDSRRAMKILDTSAPNVSTDVCVFTSLPFCGTGSLCLCLFVCTCACMGAVHVCVFGDFIFPK